MFWGKRGSVPPDRIVSHLRCSRLSFYLSPTLTGWAKLSRASGAPKRRLMIQCCTDSCGSKAVQPLVDCI